jgi:integrase
MGRTYKRLSDRTTRNLKPGLHADGGGLYLQVTTGGARSWILRTLIHGKRRDMGLGGWPVISLAEAREKALSYRKIARHGGDPIAERNREKASSLTFEVAARKVHQAHSPTWRNEKHAAQWINTLDEYAFPVFGSKSIGLVDQADVLKALAPIWITKPETACRVRQRIGTVMDWALASGHRTARNPVEGIERGLPKQNRGTEHHLAMPFADVPAFIPRLREIEAAESVKRALEFLILTATRTNEVLLAKWTEVDLGAAVWTIPAERMKAKREHRVPLSTRALSILQEVKAENARGDYVFPGRGGEKPLSNMAFLMLLRRMKLSFTAHGFRSSFRDWTAEKTNDPRDVAEAALAHAVKDQTEAAYRRTDLFERRRDLMQHWSEFATQAGGKVVSGRFGKAA